MKRRNLRNLILLVLLMAVLISVYCVIRNNNLKNQEEQNTDEKVLSLELSDVVLIQFTLDGKQVTFVKDGDTWKLSGDDSFQVNVSAVENAILAVTDMTSERTLEEITDLAEYGLDKPVQTVVLKSQEDVSCNIYFGNSNEVTGNDYVCLDDDKTRVYTVSSSVAQNFMSTLEDYRDTEEEGESTEADVTE